MGSVNRSRLALMLVLAALASLGAAPSASTASLCEEGVAHDYAKPLKEMPALPSYPFGEEQGLPFGPRGIALTRKRQAQLMLPGAREVGYALSHSRRFGAEGPIDVDWLVTAKLARVGRQGQVLESLGWKSRQVTHLGRNSTARFPLSFSGEVGFYKLEIVFRNEAGKQLGRFGEYVRVLEPSFDARLELNASTFHPGEVLQARLANYGTEFLSFGFSKRIEFNNGYGWVKTEIDAGPVILIGLGLGPGAAATCWKANLPPDTPPGLYRFALDLQHGQEPPVRSEPTTLTAEFQVVPGP